MGIEEGGLLYEEKMKGRFADRRLVYIRFFRTDFFIADFLGKI